MTFSLYELLLLVGIIQGSLTSVLLVVTKKNKLSNRILALGLFSFCLLSAKMVLNSIGLLNLADFRYLPVSTQLAIPPLMYLYLITLISPKSRLTWKTSLHFIPFIAIQVFTLLVYFSVRELNSVIEQDQVANLFMYNPVKWVEDYFTVVSIGCYLGFGFIELKGYRQRVNDTVSDSNYPTFTWLIKIFILSTILGIFLLGNMIVEWLFDLSRTTSLHWQVYFVYISFLIYYLGFAGYKQPNYQNISIVPEPKLDDKKAPQKSLNSQLSQIIHALDVELLNHKVYLDPTLSSRDLAKLLNISQTALSFAINTHYQKTFREVINELRIEEVKEKLTLNGLSGQSILSIALDSGFNSEASFYRIFKKQEGLAPKAYLSKLSKE